MSNDKYKPDLDIDSVKIEYMSYGSSGALKAAIAALLLFAIAAVIMFVTGV